MSYDPQKFIQYINFMSWNGKEDINRKITPDFLSSKFLEIAKKQILKKFKRVIYLTIMKNSDQKV